MNPDQLNFSWPGILIPPKKQPSKFNTVYTAKAVKLLWLHERPAPRALLICDSPETSARYHREVIQQDPAYNQDVEQFVALLLNVRCRCIAYHVISTGILDTILVHAREVFRAAIVANASRLVLMHNHPSGDPSPSEADIKVTRDLIRAGNTLKIEVLDHVIIGHPSDPPSSLRQLGYFAT